MKLMLIAALGLVLTATAEPVTRVQLKTPLPKPLPGVTPIPIKVSNLAPPPVLSNGVPPVFVSTGATNLALGAKVTASDSEPLIGEIDYVTDGDKSGEEGSYVELAGGTQWVQIDLGRTAAIEAVLLWHFHFGLRVYHDVVIQVSDDRDFVTGVTTVFNNDHDNTAGLGAGSDQAYIETHIGKWIPANASGRYVRLYSRGSTASGMNHYCEVEVWGEPALAAK